jgi:hypothetical protein
MVGRLWSAALCSTNQHHQIQLSTYCLPYIRLPKTPNHNMFTLKMATSMSAETLEIFRHSTQLIPESRSCTMNSSRENQRTIEFSHTDK